MIHDENVQYVKEFLQHEPQGKISKNYKLTDDGMLLFKDKCHVPHVTNSKKLIMDEFHKISYSGHSVYQKMITTIKKSYYWPIIKKEIVEYISE